MTKYELNQLQQQEIRNRINAFGKDKLMRKYYENVLLGLEIKAGKMTIEEASEEIF